MGKETDKQTNILPNLVPIHLSELNINPYSRTLEETHQEINCTAEF